MPAPAAGRAGERPAHRAPALAAALAGDGGGEPAAGRAAGRRDCGKARARRAAAPKDGGGGPAAAGGLWDLAGGVGWMEGAGPLVGAGLTERGRGRLGW